MWSVPKSNVEAVKKAAGRYGVVVHQVGANRTGLLGPAAADMPMDDKRRLILEQAKASLAIVGIKMSVMPPAGDRRICADRRRGPAGRRQRPSEDDGRAQREHGRRHHRLARRRAIRHDRAAGHGRRHRRAGGPHVVARRQDGRHHSAPGPPLFLPAHGRPGARGRRDDRGPHAARAWAHAAARARQRPEPARRPPGHTGRGQPVAAAGLRPGRRSPRPHRRLWAERQHKKARRSPRT